MRLDIEVDKSFARIGDELSYTVHITNNELQDAKEVVLNDRLPKEVEIQRESIRIGSAYKTGDLVEGMSLGDIPKGETLTVSFGVKIQKLPVLHSITNTLDIMFSLGDEEEAKREQSNTVITLVTDPNLTTDVGCFSFYADKDIVDIGEEITYTIELINKGNVAATQLVLSNLYPASTYLIEESLTINGASYSFGQASTIELEQIKVGETKTIKYNVKVDQRVDTFKVSHQVELTYEFMMANRQIATDRQLSEPYIVQIETATFSALLGGVLKRVSKETCTVGEELTYTITLTNQGNQVAYNVYYNQSVPLGSQWVQGSLIIGDKYYSLSNDEKGIVLPSIRPQDSVTIIYKVSVEDEIPPHGKLIQKGEITYEYQVGECKKKGEEIENEIVIDVLAAELKAHELGSRLQAQQGIVSLNEPIQYELVLKNEGNIAAEAIAIKVSLPKEVKVQDHAWEVKEGIAYIEHRKPLLPGEAYTIPLEVISTQVPESGVLNLMSQITYQYQIGTETKTKTLLCPQATPTTLQVAILSQENQGIRKFVQPQVVQVDDELTYTIELTNTGNTAALQVNVKEILPPELVLLTDENLLSEGIIIPSIQPSEQARISYKVKVVAIPPQNGVQTSSYINFNYKVGEDDLRKGYTESISPMIPVHMAQVESWNQLQDISVDRVYATIGDYISYTLEIGNKGNVPAEEVTVSLPTLEGAVWEDGDTFIGTLGVGEHIQRTYVLQVESLPQSQSVSTQIQVSYCFKLGDKNKINKTYLTNSVNTPIKAPKIQIIDGGLKKQVDKLIVTHQDELIYTLAITNTGNTIAEGITLTETLPEAVRFISDSVEIGGQKQDGVALEQPILLGTLAPGEIQILSYKVRVEGLPVEQNIQTISQLAYTYHLEGEAEKRERVSEKVWSPATAVLDTRMRYEEHTLKQEVDKAFVDIGDVVTYSVSMSNTGNTTAISPYYQVLLSEGLVYEANSLQLNGVKIIADLAQIKLATLAPEQSEVLTFQAKVVALPEAGKVSATGILNYTLQKSQHEMIEITERIPETQVQIQTAGPSEVEDFWLEIDENEVGYESRLNKTLVIKNAGNQTMKNTWLRQVEGAIYLNFQNPEGLFIGELAPLESKEVNIRCQVVELPKAALTYQSAELSYEYAVGNEENLKQVTKRSNRVPLNIQDTSLKRQGQVTLQADKSYAELGEIITYTGKVYNTGNTSAHQVTIGIESIEALEVMKETITMQQSNQWGQRNGIIVIEEVKPGEYLQVDFKAKVVGIPEGDKVSAQLTIDYTYRDTSGQIIPSHVTTHPALTMIRTVDLSTGINKIIEYDEYTVGEVIHYQIQCHNKGNISAEEVKIKQMFPQGIQMKPETLKIKDGNRLRWTPNQEIIVDEIKADEALEIVFDAEVMALSKQDIGLDTTTLSYKAQVIWEEEKRTQELPALVQRIKLISPEIKIAVKIEETQIILGDWINGVITIVHQGNQKAQKLGLDEIFPEGVEVVWPEPWQTLAIPDLNRGEQVVIPFKAKVTQKQPKGILSVCPKIACTFNLRGDEWTKTYVGECVAVEVHTTQLEMMISSDKDHTKVEVGQSVEYSITLTNTGSLKAEHIIVYNQLPKPVRFAAGSVEVKGKRIAVNELQEGINAGYLDPKESLTINCKAIVVAYQEKRIKNGVYATCHYTLRKDEDVRELETPINTHEILAASPYRTPLVEHKLWTLPAQLTDMSQVDELEVEIGVVGIRYNPENEYKIEVTAQVHYTVPYTDRAGDRQKACFTQLLVKQMPWSHIGDMQQLEVAIEVEQARVRRINARQLEGHITFMIEG